MTQIQQGAIEVSATFLLVTVYYVRSWVKLKDCDHKKLGWMAVTGLGGVTGVFIFIGSFQVMTISVLNGVWSGIAGIVIIFATATEIIKEFQSLSKAPEVLPVKTTPEQSSATSAK